MKTLCLFTNEFPYGSWEPYLETEVKYYKEFEKVYIFSLQLRSEHAKTKRNVPENCEVIAVPYAPKWVYLINSFKALTDRNLYAELSELKKTHRLSLKHIVDMFVFFSRSHYETGIIFKAIKKKQLGETCFYSYRFEYQPYVALLLKKRLGIKGKVVSRAHRYDLYEFSHAHNYIPGRKILLDNLDHIYPCSDDGTNYLKKPFPEYSSKINTRFLGTIDHGLNGGESDEFFRIVSCSTVTPVKRLDLIVEALKRIEDKKIKWTHFGDGPLFDSVLKMTQGLPTNIQIDFRGNIANSELLDIYKTNHFDLFINVSESEGIPVSIMEAMSFGMPCLATNAGGTGEIVENGNGGVLIPVDITPEMLAAEIRKLIDSDAQTTRELRKLSRARWENKFNADVNYKAFVNELLL